MTRPAFRFRYGALAAVAGGIVAGMVIRLAILDRTAPDLTRGSAPFTIRGPAGGFTASQLFDVENDGLEGVRLEAEVSGDGGGGILEARLVELPAGGGEREARQAMVSPSRSDGDCCAFRFAALTDSAGRRYRVDLRARDFQGGRQLALRARPSRGEGGLVLNGAPQRANLAIEPIGAAIYPLKGAFRLSLWWLMAGFAVVDGAVGFVIYALAVGARRDGPEAQRANASDPRLP